MESLKGTLYSIAIFALLIVPAMVDIFSASVVTSQLNRTGAEMIQVIGSSSSYDSRTETAIELAESKYGINVEIESGTDYGLGDMVDITLEKGFTRMLPVPGNESEGGDGEFHQTTFKTQESVMITKRND